MKRRLSGEKKKRHVVYYHTEQKRREVEANMKEHFGSITEGYRIIYEYWFNSPAIKGSLESIYKELLECHQRGELEEVMKEVKRRKAEEKRRRG